MRRLSILALGCLAVAGCTPLRPGLSFASPAATAHDASALARDAAQHLTTIYPPAQTTFIVYPTASPRQDAATAAFIDAMRSTGVGVAEAPRRADEPTPYGVPVRYQVTPLDGGILMRLQYQGAAAARFYRRGPDGALMATAPFTVREAAR